MPESSISIQLPFPFWLVLVLVLAFLLNAVEPIIRFLNRLWGLSLMICQWYYKHRKAWPVEILVDSSRLVPNWLVQQPGSVEASLGLELKCGVSEAILRDLEMVLTDTGQRIRPSASSAIAGPAQWADGMELKTRGDAIRVNFSAFRDDRKVRFKLVANGRLCESGVVEIPE